MKICVNCNEIIDLDKIKYCPFCTSDKLKSFRLSEYLKPNKISILFEYGATGKTYQDYLAIKDHPNYFDVGNRQKKYVGLWFDDNDDLFHKIPPLHTEYSVYHDGKRVNTTNYKKCVLCYRNRQKADFPEYYCYGVPNHSEYLIPNLVGCIQMRLGLSVYSRFYRNYKLQDIFGNYKFVRSEVLKKTNYYLNQYGICPHINKETILRFVNMLPDQVNPRVDTSWIDFPTSTYKNRFPVITDTQYLISLINDLYPMEYRTQELTRALEVTFDAITFEINRITENVKQRI